MTSNVMKAVLLTGHGGPEKLVHREDVPIPNVGPHDVLVKVGACAVNNTDIWTREGAYGSTQDENEPTGWQRSALLCPRIQGLDIAGRIESVGSNIASDRIGQRVLVNPNIYDQHGKVVVIIGSERDGGFAEYCAVPSVNAIQISSDYSDTELASFPSAFGTAEAMLNKASVSANDTILITGASGGVGSALIQLSKLRDTKTISIVGSGKEEMAKKLGSDYVINREDSFEEQIRQIGQDKSITVIADVVAGQVFPQLFNVIAYHGRYVNAGAIAGPIVKFDMRTIYLNELKLFGSTGFSSDEFKDLITYIESKKN